MKRSLQTLFAVAAAIMLLPGCDALQTEYSDLKARVDVLDGTTIPSLEQQETAINGTIAQLEQFKATLGERVDALESDGDASQKDIADLEETVENMDKQIAALKTHAKHLDEDTRTWAEGTFLTLTAALNLSGSMMSIERLNMGAYKAQIQSQVNTIEASLKTWVGEQLVDYAKISDVTAKIDQLKTDAATANGELKTELEAKIATLQTEFTDAKSYFETSLKEAIEKACAANGLIDTEIARQINDAKTTLQGKTDTLEDSIEDLETRIAAVEQTIKDLLGRIQSIKAVPAYTDGSTDVPGSVKFEIQPLEAAKALVELTGVKDSLSFQAVEVVTKAGESSFKNFTVESVEMDSLGEFVVVTVAIPEDASWKEAFEAGTLSLQARLRLEAYKGSGNYVDKASAFFPVNYAAPAPTHDAVQLWEGGPYWATTNIGASTPEEYGYYFAWGYTEGCVRNSSNDGWVKADDSSSSARRAFIGLVRRRITPARTTSTSNRTPTIPVVYTAAISTLATLSVPSTTDLVHPLKA